MHKPVKPGEILADLSKSHSSKAISHMTIMDQTQSRIRWTTQEKQTLAAKMVEISAADPRLSRLQQLQRAQDILPEGRRRKLLSWASVKAAFEPILDTAKAAYGANQLALRASQDRSIPKLIDQATRNGATPAVGEAGANILDTDIGMEVVEPIGKRGQQEDVQRRPLQGLAGVFEDAFLQALSSPRVRTLLSQILGEGLQRVSAQAHAVTTDGDALIEVASKRDDDISLPDTESAKILVMGLTEEEERKLREEVGENTDVRFWRETHTRQELCNQAKKCSVALVPARMFDSPNTTILRSMPNLHVIKHTGTTALLPQKLKELKQMGALFSRSL